LIESVGPASLLVVIDSRMSGTLKKQLAPEDILQDALLHAWRDRARFEWRGLKSFRSWLLTIIDHRIRDAATREGAAKRGGGESPVPFSVLERGPSPGQAESHFAGPVASTTPSRLAIHKEQASAMHAALGAIPAELREIVRLRLFEQIGVKDVAQRLGIGVSAVRHRFRKGAEMYRRVLLSELASRSQALSKERLHMENGDSAPKE
jgi:RNA polymerase sigma factor (sigma-70 family)